MLPSEQIRRAIRDSGLSLYRVAKDSGIAYSVLFRFMDGSGISTETLDRISKVIPMDVTVKEEPKGRKGGKER